MARAVITTPAGVFMAAVEDNAERHRADTIPNPLWGGWRAYGTEQMGSTRPWRSGLTDGIVREAADRAGERLNPQVHVEARADFWRSSVFRRAVMSGWRT